MKRYKIIFCEREAGSKAKWSRITEEDYDELNEVKDRFFKAVAASFNSINSVTITVIDMRRMEYDMPDEEIMEFTYIV
jgi:hypothetical protein